MSRSPRRFVETMLAAYGSGGKVPNLRTLKRLAVSVGLEPAVKFVPKMTREDRRSLALHARIAEELLAEPGLVLSQARSNLQRMQQLHPGARPLLDQWEHILDGPLEVVVAVLQDPRVPFRDLRQVTPFAGVLDPGERTKVIQGFRKEEKRRGKVAV